MYLFHYFRKSLIEENNDFFPFEINSAYPNFLCKVVRYW